MIRKMMAAVLMVLIIGAGVWYYFTRIQHASIQKILGSPKAYEGNEVTIEGEVTDRTSFFIIAKFFKVRDKTGEIVVITKGRTLPEIKSEVRVRGRVDETFSIGDQKLVVVVAEAIDMKEKEKSK